MPVAPRCFIKYDFSWIGRPYDCYVSYSRTVNGPFLSTAQELEPDVVDDSDSERSDIQENTSN